MRGRTQLPTSLRIGPYDWRIKHQGIEWRQSTEKHGETVYDALLLNVCTEENKYQVLDTGVHEVLHTLYDLYHLEKGDEEERVVACLASGLVQVLRDNPAFLKYINEVCK